MVPSLGCGLHRARTPAMRAQTQTGSVRYSWQQERSRAEIHLESWNARHWSTAQPPSHRTHRVLPTSLPCPAPTCATTGVPAARALCWRRPAGEQRISVLLQHECSPPMSLDGWAWLGCWCWCCRCRCRAVNNSLCFPLQPLLDLANCQTPSPCLGGLDLTAAAGAAPGGA